MASYRVCLFVPPQVFRCRICLFLQTQKTKGEKEKTLNKADLSIQTVAFIRFALGKKSKQKPKKVEVWPATWRQFAICCPGFFVEIRLIVG